MGPPLNLDLVCSFCGRDVRISRPHVLSQPDAVICGDCATLATEMLSEPAEPDPQPVLRCSFCAGEGTRTVPGPTGVAICARCAELWLEGTPR